MIRGLPKRVVALIGVLFLLLNTAGEAFGVLACPCHEEQHHSEAGPGSAHEGGATAADAHHHQGEDAHACHHAHGNELAHEGRNAPPPDRSHPTSSEASRASDAAHDPEHGAETCPHMGHCHVPAATPVDDRLTITVAWWGGVVRLSDVAPRSEASPAFHPPFFLPYSLAPPLLG